MVDLAGDLSDSDRVQLFEDEELDPENRMPYVTVGESDLDNDDLEEGTEGYSCIEKDPATFEAECRRLDEETPP